MDLRGRSLRPRYDTSDEALRWALVAMAEASGLNKYLLAPQIDLSPSHFSKALNPNKSDDDTERRHHFPADRIARFIEVTGDASYLLTLLDALGYDPAKLPEIRRRVKTREELEEEKIERLKVIEEQLRLIAEEPGQKVRKR